MDTNQLITHTKDLITTHAGPDAAPPYRVILGLSGGPDSVFLFHLLRMLAEEGFLHITAAHLNHQWRGQASDDDAAFCQELANQHGIDFVVKTAAEISISYKYNGSPEEHGRMLRRAFFNQLASELSASAVLLAHHADDQLETFFIRLIRGSSLEGLAGLRASAGLYLRPLLSLSKEEILYWLARGGHSFCTDATNTQPQFLRNRIRTSLIPVLSAIDSRAVANSLHAINRLQTTEAFIEKLTQTAFETIFTQAPDGPLVGSLSAFQKQDVLIQKRLLVLLMSRSEAPCTHTEAFLEEMLRFLCSPRGGKHLLTPGWALHKKQALFWIETETAYPLL